MNNWTDSSLARIVNEAMNDINGYTPIALAYRRMVLSKGFGRKAREERRRAELEFIQTFIRVMWRNRATERENIRNLLFFSKFFQTMGIFQMVTIATPSKFLISMGPAVLSSETGIIQAPKMLVELKSNDPMNNIVKVRILNVLVTLLREGHFKISDNVEELLYRIELVGQLPSMNQMQEKFMNG